jgi:hypothetical protein
MASFVFVDFKSPTPLCEIMGRNKSDKGSLDITTCWHNYTTFYHAIFSSLRDCDIRVFELGLGTNNVELPSNMGANGRPGASLYGWSEYFPNASIFGADIDATILFQTDRIETFYCDQTIPDVVLQMWREPPLLEDFDIIVEDGLHEFSANVCFFENSVHKLKKMGYFIIEDILNDEKHLFVEKIKEWETRFPDCTFKLLEIPSAVNTIDNNLLMVHRSK